MYVIVYLSARKDTVFFLIDKEIIRCKMTQLELRLPNKPKCFKFFLFPNPKGRKKLYRFRISHPLGLGKRVFGCEILDTL